MVFHIPWHNGVNLHAIVQEGHAALLINSYPGYIFNLVPLVKGVRIQEESLCSVFYALGVPSWDTFGLDVFP